MDASEAVRECITELGEVLLTISHSPSASQRDRAARIIDRVREDLGEAASLLRAG
jgi:hypothetical protein